jgi:anaerobic glycerol-3-phosphate dehydrogenase
MEPIDVAVLGGGAAGIAAARAAHDAGVARIALVAPDAGATEMSAGWIAGDVGDAPAWLPEAGLRAPGNHAFATVGGAVVRAASGLPSLLDLAALPEGALGVVDLVAGPAWAPDLVARALGEALGREARVVGAGAGARRGETPGELARALDSAGVAEALAESLRAGARGCAALLFPPVLGLARDDVYARLTRALGLVVGEAGGMPGDPPGVRLARALARVVPAAVVRVAARATVEAGPEGRARVRAGEQVFEARAVVLATGGLASGGLRFEAMMKEPCAGAPVWLSREDGGMVLPAPSADRGMDPAPLFAPDAHGHVAALGAGVRLTVDGRVAGPDGRSALHPWLFAAGAVVAGGRAPYGFPLAGALAAGHVAGTRAAAFLRG